MITFDYVTKEAAEGGGWDIQIGLKFDDEPEELYVAHVHMDDQGILGVPVLYFNGMDCRYAWKTDERVALETFVRQSTARIGE
ncbi:hypothetical protein ACFFK0_17545 [Paenibacillus chartarius]|uniref:Thioredoxin n=1 Tax=Paenibacillus chartarius TaxID=747481 RepID=A0ABV6DNM8_9BACL